MAGRFQAELLTALPRWKERLRANPDRLVEVEQDVHAAFARGADLLVVGLIALVMKTPEFAAGGERTRQNTAVPLGRGRERQIQVRLLGGLIMWITSLYCAPRKQWFGRPPEKTPGMGPIWKSEPVSIVKAEPLGQWIRRVPSVFPSRAPF